MMMVMMMIILMVRIVMMMIVMMVMRSSYRALARISTDFGRSEAPRAAQPFGACLGTLCRPSVFLLFKAPGAAHFLELRLIRPSSSSLAGI